jgi:hypothetical protein
MRYLILFENYESDLWEEIFASSYYEDFDLVPISERRKNEIISLFSDGEIDILLNTAHTLQIRYIFPREIYRELDVFGTISNETNLTVDLTDDYYFLVCVEFGFDIRCFKCDEVVGLKRMLTDTGILYL